MKLTKQDIDKVRHIEGFPIGSDEDIIALSNPPYYTACPNPFIEEFIKQNGKIYDEETDNYKREPFAADVSEGKNDAIYNAHNYHTKVPYKAIMNYILHYTEPGDIIYDGFSGTGMTGVAAQMCGKDDQILKTQFESVHENIKWGSRKAILNDLSPIATFISHNYNFDIDAEEYKLQANKILNEFNKECNWIYETNHTAGDMNLQQSLNIYNEGKGVINYVVWSDIFICPNCGEEIVFWEVSVDKNTGNVFQKFNCQKCGVELNKKSCKRAVEVYYDEKIKENLTIAKQKPVLINYTYNGKKFEKIPDKDDIEVISKINQMQIPYNYPINELPFGYNTEQPRNSHGINYIHQFYTKRNLFAISKIYDLLNKNNSTVKNALFFTFEQILLGMSKLARYVPNHFSQVNQYLSGTLYIGSQVVEVTPQYILENKIKNLVKVFSNKYINNEEVIVSNNSTTNILAPENSIDYIFTDPPFGDNLNYSELSFIWESWLQIRTNNKDEAIINKAQGKSIVEYQELMSKCFKEYYRILKPNRWITIEFHNSKNAVWNSIQESLNRAGFIVADVRILDKKQGSFKQVTSTSAVKQDLVIAAYKPTNKFLNKVFKHSGTHETAWDFVKEHLNKLPIVIVKNGKLEIVRERENYLLFDRMVAYHIVNGLPIPLDASEFYIGLDEKFIKRDGMYFLQDQVNEYDNARIISDIEPVQFSLFVIDEKNAIAWLYQQLDKPQTYSDIQPKFIQELRTIKHEKMPELMELLEENFIQDKAGKWYIPDPTKAGDIIKLREKRLIKEFEEYLEGKGKLKSFRTEAVRAGFAKLWKEKDYHNIVKVANRLPESVIQEDDKLLMYYDISLSRIE